MKILACLKPLNLVLKSGESVEANAMDINAKTIRKADEGYSKLRTRSVCPSEWDRWGRGMWQN